MKTIRVLATREQDTAGRPVAASVCLEKFVVGRGGNDSEALANMLAQLKGHEELPTFGQLAAAPEDYQKKWAESTRESQVVRGDYQIQVRSG